VRFINEQKFSAELAVIWSGSECRKVLEWCNCKR